MFSRRGEQSVVVSTKLKEVSREGVAAFSMRKFARFSKLARSPVDRDDCAWQDALIKSATAKMSVRTRRA